MENPLLPFRETGWLIFRQALAAQVIYLNKQYLQITGGKNIWLCQPMAVWETK